MKNHILKTGIELEALFSETPNGFKEDGSVHFDDSDCDCERDCDCADYCECQQCLCCDQCEETTTRCNCDDCLHCDDCNNQLDSCECLPEYQKLCDDKKCTIDDLCEECKENCLDAMIESRDITHDCNNTGNARYICNFECSCIENCSCSCNCGCDRAGEVASKPLENKKEVEDFMRITYEDIERLNSSCGMHTHKSFKDKYRDISVLCSQDFHNVFRDSMYDWAINRNINEGSRFFKRLQGVEYCLDEFQGHAQLAKESSTRYTMLNFQSVHIRDTLEIRLSTMFDDVNIGIEYLNQVDVIINDYLNSHKPKEFDFELKLGKNTHISINLKMVKDGLRIFVKSSGLESIMKNSDLMTMPKYKLYDNNMDIESLNSNLESLYNSDNYNDLNMCFLRLVGQNNGKSMIIPKPFSEYQIEQYYDQLITKLPMMIRRIKGVKKICA